MAKNINKPCYTLGKGIPAPGIHSRCPTNPYQHKPKVKNVVENDQNVNNKYAKKICTPDEIRKISYNAILQLQGKIMSENEKRIKECSFGTYWKYCMNCNPELRKSGKIEDGKICTVKDLQNGLMLKMNSFKNRKTVEEIIKEKIIKRSSSSKIPQHRNVRKYGNESYKLKQGNITNITSNKMSNARKSQAEAKFKIKNDPGNRNAAKVTQFASNKKTSALKSLAMIKKLCEKDSKDKVIKDCIKIIEDHGKPSKPSDVKTVSKDKNNTSVTISNNSITTSSNANSVDKKSLSQFGNQKLCINHKESSPSNNSTVNFKTSVTSKSTQAVLISQSLKYPLVVKEDLESLAEGKYLNDTVIEFYLKYIFNEKLSLNTQKKTYMCSTFVYTKFLEQKKLMEADGTIFEVPVREWLKDADLFSKDFIFMPINSNGNHWYLVVICFLSQLSNIYLDDVETGTKAIRFQSKLKKLPKENVLSEKQPCFCFFDSNDNSVQLNDSKVQVTKDLMYLLKALWLKRKTRQNCNWRELIPLKILCLQQSDTYNCGIFLLQYAESFFKAPIVINEDGYPSAKHWFSKSVIANKRNEIKKIIKERQKK